MNDVPYTTPDEDPFNIQPLQPRRRRSSLLDKWIQEQQKQPPVSVATQHPPDRHTSQLRITPYIAYPDLTLERVATRDEAVTLNNYDLVEDDDIPQDIFCESELPSTPTRSRRTSKLLQTPSSFRNFNISFRSASPAISRHSHNGSPRPSSRLSLFPRSPRHSTDATTGKTTPHQHGRSSSLSTLNLPGKAVASSDAVSSGASSRWRPSVLGHFSTAGVSQASDTPSDTVYTPSRPSVSSRDTYTTTTTTTTTEIDLPPTPPKLSFMNSMRSRHRSHGGVFKSGSGIDSSSSIWSHNNLDVPSPSMHVRSMSGSEIPSSSSSTLAHGASTKRIPLAPKLKSRLAHSNIDHADYEEDSEEQDDEKMTKVIKYDPTRPHIAYSSGGTLPRVNFASLSSRQRKKKKLVIIGVTLEDERKFQGVKRWCESFGEVSQIMRMPNGELHVHFRLAEVADTVCRLRARVYIAGVGSVQLSWYTGDKR